MADELTPAPAEAKDMDLEQQIRAVLAKIKAEAEAADVVDTPPSDPAPNPTPMGADEPAAAMDALREQVADLTAKLAVAQDSGAVIANIAARDALYAKVSPFVGAFDHASMTADQLAAYAVKKLEVPCTAGAERVALDAWLHGRTPDSKKPAFSADSAAKPVDLNTLWKETK